MADDTLKYTSLHINAITNPAKMPEIEIPDPDELGGNVTKPFKFVTGMAYFPDKLESTTL